MMNRKDFLLGAALLPTLSFKEAADKKRKSFSVAHITDIHVKPGLIPEKGMATVLHAIQTSTTKAAFIINTGDAIMDALVE
ncbi:MAG: metallophosphoesterase, partial [Chitinophagaceae bacterium]